MAKTDKITIDQNELTPSARRKMDRILRPRDTVFSARFVAADIARWRAAAKAADQSLRQWVESALEAAASRAGVKPR